MATRLTNISQLHTCILRFFVHSIILKTPLRLGAGGYSLRLLGATLSIVSSLGIETVTLRTEILDTDLCELPMSTNTLVLMVIGITE